MCSNKIVTLQKPEAGRAGAEAERWPRGQLIDHPRCHPQKINKWGGNHLWHFKDGQLEQKNCNYLSGVEKRKKTFLSH